jgi:hypothetical protein
MGNLLYVCPTPVALGKAYTLLVGLKEERIIFTKLFIKDMLNIDYGCPYLQWVSLFLSLSLCVSFSLYLSLTPMRFFSHNVSFFLSNSLSFSSSSLSLLLFISPALYISCSVSLFLSISLAFYLFYIFIFIYFSSCPSLLSPIATGTKLQFSFKICPIPDSQLQYRICLLRRFCIPFILSLVQRNLTLIPSEITFWLNRMN